MPTSNVNSESNPNRWTDEVTARFANESERTTPSLPLHKIIREFKQHVGEMNPKEKKDLAHKIATLSADKIEYYQSTRFGFIKQFYSSLRNLVHMGTFTSSGKLGYKLAYALEKSPVLPPPVHKKEDLQIPSERVPNPENARPISDKEPDSQQVIEEAVNALEKAFGDLDVEGLAEVNPDSVIETEALRYNTEKEEMEIKTWLRSDEFKEKLAQPAGMAAFLLILQANAATQDFKKIFEILKAVAWETDQEEAFQEEEKDKIPSPVPQNVEEIDAPDFSLPVKTNEEGSEAEVKVEKDPSKSEKLKEPEIKKEADIAESPAPLEPRIATIEVTPIQTPPRTPVALTAKEKMIETFYSIWQHASETDRAWIQDIWEATMKSAEVVAWEPIKGKANSYRLELKKELSGNPPPFGKIVIQKEMEIVFTEEQMPGSEEFRQVISFPKKDKGIVYRVPFFSTALQKICVEKEDGDTMVTGVAFGKEQKKSALFVRNFWRNLEWS